jgi:hypothetical protein
VSVQLRSDDVLQYLPQFPAASSARDAAPSVAKAKGPRNTLGGKGERDLSFFVAKPDVVVQTEAISPQYDTVRKAAPTAVFGSAARPSICGEPDDRTELNVSDNFMRYVGVSASPPQQIVSTQHALSAIASVVGVSYTRR